MKYTILFSLLLSFSISSAEELLIRADKHQPKELPTWSKMPSASPACNNQGISMKYLSFFGNENLHPALMQFQNNKSFFSNYFEADLSISDLHLTKDQKTIFALNYRGGTEGIYSFSEKFQLTLLVPKESFPNAIAMSRPSIVNNQVLFRALNKDGLHTIYLGPKAILNEANNTAYLYLPTSKNNQIVLKVGHGTPGEVNRTNPDKILSISNNIETIVAVDKDLDPTSKFIGFDNSPIPNGAGGVAFIAEHEEHKRSLWLFEKGSLSLIFSEASSPYKLEYFSPDVNSNGDIVFRVIKDKRRSVLKWSSETKELTTLLAQGQKVVVNEEDIQIIDRDKWPAFSGKPCINKNGEIFIHAVLESSLTKENKGSAVFKFSSTSD